MRGKKKGVCSYFWMGVIILGLIYSGCETQSSLAKKRIKDIENGLLRAVYFKGQKPEKLRLEERMVFYRVPGLCLAAIDNDSLSWVKGYGYRDSKENGPVTSETIFQAGAFSQPIVAALALILVEEGKLSLDRDVNEYLKSWKVLRTELSGGRPITLRDLLVHRAGFSSWVFPGYSKEEALPTLLQILRGEKPAINTPIIPLDKPGTIIRTSESGYLVLQHLIEETSGRSLAELAKERIFTPVGMKNSFFAAEVPSEIMAKVASGHQRNGSHYPEKWRRYPELGAKGLWTTASDMALFIAELMASARGTSGKFISPVAARAMLTIQAGSRGFGFIIEGSGDDVYFHLEGRTAGFACALVAFPAKKQGLVAMTNSDNGQILIEEIFRAAAAVYNWPHFKPIERPLYRLEPSVYQQYVGRYEISPDYILEVKSEDYYLIIQPTGQAPTKFYVESETVFFSVDPFIRIQFRRDERGNVTHLVLWQQDFEQIARKIS
ncbi:MAG: beta-lactamase family protein [Candidatus Aminicenantes bacterium]|nr:beta-lactamase family protein [Candidatus Aminicenantes bacterium]